MSILFRKNNWPDWSCIKLEFLSNFFRLTLIVTSLFLGSCKTNQSVKADNSGAITDGKAVHGMYSGMLPCADCEKIEFVLSLGDDMTWKSSMKYVGKSNNTFSENGKYYIREDEVIVLDRAEAGMKYFGKDPKGLRMLDVNGQKITGENADLYILKLLTGSQRIPLYGSKDDLLRDRLSHELIFMRLVMSRHGNWSLILRKVLHSIHRPE